MAIDYDPGASEVNQLNRIKLMMDAAHKNLEKTAFKKEKRISIPVNSKENNISI